MSGISSIAGDVAAAVARIPGADHAAMAKALGDVPELSAASAELTNLVSARIGYTHAIDALQGVKVRTTQSVMAWLELPGGMGLTSRNARDLRAAVHQAQVGVSLAAPYKNAGGFEGIPRKLQDLDMKILDASRRGAPYQVVADAKAAHRTTLDSLHYVSNWIDHRLGQLKVDEDVANVAALADGIKSSLLGITR